MTLDPSTLFFAETVTSVISAVGFSILLREVVIPGARRWIVSNLLLAASLILLAVSGVHAPPTPAMTLTLMLVFVSYVYQIEAIFTFSELAYKPVLARAYELIGLGALVFAFGSRQLEVLALTLGAFIALPTLTVIWRVLVRRSRPLRFADFFIAFGYAALLADGILAVVTVPGRTVDGHLLNGPGQSLFYGLSFLAVLCTQAAYIVMTKQESDYRLMHLATIDPLTDIWNRRTFLEAMTVEQQRCRRKGAPLAVVMFDLDHFKRVNDTHGHAVGDLVLKAFARVLRSALREYDRVGRYGGEEFVIFLPETGCADAVAIAERVCELCRASPVELHGRSVAFTTSGGVAVDAGGQTIDELLSHADGALYRAKAAGRDRVLLATESEAVLA